MEFCIEEKLPRKLDGVRVIFCDGAGSEAFRPACDLELSHWFPNQTPERFTADTSTEICLRFVASGIGTGAYDLVVNNHVDVDGILSVFSVLEPELALRHRETLVQAAEMGDFWGWGERPAQVLCQALTQLFDGSEPIDAAAVYRRGFDLTRRVLGGHEPPGVQRDLDALAESVDRIERGEIARERYGARFVHYALPSVATADRLEAALKVVPFNAPLGDGFALLPHACARLDRECITLRSVESEKGYYYDLYYPGYSWAETPNSWRPPGLTKLETSNLQRVDWPRLNRAADDLDQNEEAEGSWALCREISPFSALEGRGFPVVLCFMHAGAPAPSRTPPERVAAALASAFAGT
jgi:hypothetical protein